ncbi:MAG: DUF502 domain-containing protein [Gammaproteobacteria bacterium]|jgi:uncharacterized membrane protein|uniref:DUF502 domain-containing protein n=1 Tax=Marinomonas sp. ef1 TaxID=2005043 RepID=UPI000C2950AD|nr:DUF502 domain-containing protein [Marinomonas sp. ef1]MBU1293812.1 DUF502 domain-containing protein [Gammaproteobacteria bacterium]MBU2024886.1 DUF502 domain-containing protein [Gammaproteobacteria bacterium]MBU2319542.1 DUF502 domain-containing protein [Gammaproteobacteria bacterium]MBU2414613.1 DUF502 domain-containing protein [Gammaproteobacteria bacterium]
MNKLITLLLKGLVAVLPIGLTVYLIYWLLATGEAIAQPLLLLLIPDALYFPGLGLIASLAMLVLIGFLVNLYGFRYLVKLSHNIFERIPLVKSIYGAIKDMMMVFNLAEKKEMKSVVAIEWNGAQVIGFITGEQTGQQLFGEQNLVGVYVPLSYQIGGMTLYISRDRLTELDIGVEEAMRLALTAGVQSRPKS